MVLVLCSNWLSGRAALGIRMPCCASSIYRAVQLGFDTDDPLASLLGFLRQHYLNFTTQVQNLSQR